MVIRCRNAAAVRHRLALAGMVAAGVLAIAGSGGGFPDFQDPGPFAPAISFPDARTITAAGQPVTLALFYFLATPPTTLAWCRTPPGGTDCTPIAGATGTALTIDDPGPADDGAVYTVRASNAYGADTASIELWVSRAPPARLEIGEFALADWPIAVETVPAGNGGWMDAEAPSSAGNPGAWRRLIGQAGPGPSRLLATQVYAPAGHDPGTQGPIRVLSIVEDCRLADGLYAPEVTVTITPVLEQGGRRYLAQGDTRQCNGSRWTTLPPRPWLTAASFTLVAGAPCGDGEACPDFSATGAPMRLGWHGEFALQAGIAARAVELGIDNWHVAIWGP